MRHPPRFPPGFTQLDIPYIGHTRTLDRKIQLPRQQSPVTCSQLPPHLPLTHHPSTPSRPLPNLEKRTSIPPSLLFQAVDPSQTNSNAKRKSARPHFSSPENMQHGSETKAAGSSKVAQPGVGSRENGSGSSQGEAHRGGAAARRVLPHRRAAHPPTGGTLLSMARRGSARWVAGRAADCYSCGEGMPGGECPNSKRACGHHCNCSWVHDHCHWCGKEFGGDCEPIHASDTFSP